MSSSSACGLQDVDDNTRMLKSLAPMWAEELARIRTSQETPQGKGEDEWAPLRPPASQERDPQPLTDVAGLREELQALVNELQGREDGREGEEADELEEGGPSALGLSQANEALLGSQRGPGGSQGPEGWGGLVDEEVVMTQLVREEVEGRRRDRRRRRSAREAAREILEVACSQVAAARDDGKEGSDPQLDGEQASASSAHFPPLCPRPLLSPSPRGILNRPHPPSLPRSSWPGFIGRSRSREPACRKT